MDKVYEDDIKPFRLSDVEKKSVEWLIDGIIPKRGITCLVGDGGCGKSSLCCQIAASVSVGTPYLVAPQFWNKSAESTGNNRVLYFNGEDTFSYSLKQRLIDYDANEDNIYCLDVSSKDISNVRFDSKRLENVIMKYQPSLVILDPIQAFVPDAINMARRNAMRQYMQPLRVIAEKANCAILIVVHTNKKEGASGRARMCDSSDIWDIARSVLMMGETNDDEIRYISHEKSNYGPLALTTLFSIESGKVLFKDFSDLKDADFIAAKPKQTTQRKKSIQQEDAQAFILDYLQDGCRKEICDVDQAALQKGHSRNAIQKAKNILTKSGKIIHTSSGVAKTKKHFLQRVL